MTGWVRFCGSWFQIPGNLAAEALAGLKNA
jgi:hypothetical protein